MNKHTLRFLGAGLILLSIVFSACDTPANDNGNNGSGNQVSLKDEAEIRDYLSRQKGGDSITNPVMLSFDLQLTEAVWRGILAAIDAEKKYVALNLYDCTRSGSDSGAGLHSDGTFDPDPRVATGKDKIIALILPKVATAIEGGFSYSLGILDATPAFKHFTEITHYTIPDHITSIGEYAFEYCKLESVIIGSGVTSIGRRAFRNNRLTSVTIPGSVTSIGNDAFNQNWLTSVTISNGVTKIGDRAFLNNQLTSVTIPNTVTSIGATAFRNNRLTGVTIPESVTSIRFESFVFNQLTSITIPSNVTFIERGAFANNQLTSITIGAKVNFENFDSYASFGNGFEEAYIGIYGRAAGTYTRPDTVSTMWTKVD